MFIQYYKYDIKNMTKYHAEMSDNYMYKFKTHTSIDKGKMKVLILSIIIRVLGGLHTKT